MLRSAEPLPPPTLDTVAAHIRQFDEEQAEVECTLAKVFGLFPDNTAMEHVLPKVIVLNSLYATVIFATYEVARHIVSLEIDCLLRKGDSSAVGLIADVQLRGRKRTNYSFATKYCAWHNPCAYPIYDSYVEQMLWAYAKRDRFSTFHRQDMSNYDRFRQIISSFRNHYGLETCTLKGIDKFLWHAGQKCFPRSTWQNDGSNIA